MSGSGGEMPPRDMDEVEITDSQVPNDEQQSSCETFMSQQSENEDLSEKPEDQPADVSGFKYAETSATNSSLEGNISIENEGEGSFIGKVLSPEKLLPPEETPANLGHESDRDIFEEGSEQDDSISESRLMRKRKDRSDDSTPSPKKFLKKSHDVTTHDITEQENSPEVVFEEHSKKQDISVMEISSTPEKTIFINDSEFSLRIEENSPPAILSGDSSKSKDSQCLEPGTSQGKGVAVSPAASAASASQSQKSSATWNSHPNEDLSWSSHKDNIAVNAESEIVAQNGSCGTNSSQSPESASVINVGSVQPREHTEIRMAFLTVTWITDENNKVIAGKVKQASLLEESSGEKTGRMSIVSTTSAKSSSSSGSVGLPGPFPLPGRSRLSTLSIVTSSTHSSSASHQAWDGPFLKPSAPGSKPNLTTSCEKCLHNTVLPAVDHSVSYSPVVNGNSPIVEESEEQDVKPITQKRLRKGSAQSRSPASKSSGLLEEETSSSGSLPQASSTPTRLPRGRPKKHQNGTKTSKAEEAGNTTIKTPRVLGRASKNTTPRASAKNNEKVQGVAVLARWGGDGRYYPGWVSEPLTSSQVLVHFCDGQDKPTASAKVVNAEIITPGTLVLAATRSGEYEEALVVKVSMRGAEPFYTVERDNNQRDVEFANIALLENNVSELTLSADQKGVAVYNFNDLSLDNIIAHPRKRAARTPVPGMESGSGRKNKRQTTPQPCTSHGRTYSGPEDCYADTDSSTHSCGSFDLRGKEVKPLDVECSPPESTTYKLVYNRRNMAYKKKEGDTYGKALTQALGPIPEPGSKLFADCVFLITYTYKVHLVKQDDATISSFEENRSNTESSLWKERLRLQIRNGGGKVYNSFSEVTKDELPNTYLITDKQCNTPLYLQCLVNNVPIYSNLLIIQCCTQNRPWKEIISQRGVKRMMAGYSLSKKCLVNPRSLTPLRGKNLLLALSGDASLSTFWEMIVAKAGGTVETYHHDCLRRKHYDVVVTDTDCDRELVSVACEERVPLVSLTWLQQCIVTGEWRVPTEHSLYKYNSSSGESPEY